MPHRKSSPKSSPKFVDNRHRKSSPKIITESKGLSPCPANSTVGIEIYFCSPLSFSLFCCSNLLLVYHILDLTLHCKVEVSFTPLAQYFCMTTLDSALSLPGLRLTKKRQVM